MGLVLLGGCGNEGAMSGKRDVGRYQAVAATAEYPMMVLDTSTGCIHIISGSGSDIKSPELRAELIASISKSEITMPGGAKDPACAVPQPTEKNSGNTK
jgi:hypothetical protein